MFSFTIPKLFLLLVALLTTPIFGDYVELPGHAKSFGGLEARTPTPARKKGANSTETTSASGTANSAPNNVINLAGVGAAVFVVGTAIMF